MKLLISTSTTPKSPVPLLSDKLIVNCPLVPDGPAPRGGVTPATAIATAGVNGACHTPNACQSVLPPVWSRAATYITRFPPNAGLNAIVNVRVKVVPLPTADTRLTAHWLFWIVLVLPSTTEPAYGPPASPPSSTNISMPGWTTYAR